MIKPEVRIVEDQSESTSNFIPSSYEEQQLLAKYGYNNFISIPHTTPQPQFDSSRDLSYQEMMELEDRKYREEMSRRHQQPQRINTYSIDPNRVGYHESKWSSLEMGGSDIGIQVQIVSDMKIPGINC